MDLDTCLDPQSTIINNFNWAANLQLFRVIEQCLLQPNTWLDDVHMNASFILLYNTIFHHLYYKQHRYSFMLNMVAYRNDCMQYILVHGNDYILYDYPPRLYLLSL